MAHQSNEQLLMYQAKADVYRLLSACYYEPELVFIQEDVFGQLHRALMVLNHPWVDTAKELDISFRQVDEEALKLDYTRLFLGPFDILAKPYGSVYLDGNNIVMGESTLRAMDLYKQGGFQVDESFREMPDHFAVALEFLYLLNFRLAGATAVAQQTKFKVLLRTFLKDYLAHWTTPFTQAVEKGAQKQFYRKLAQLTHNVIMDDLRGSMALLEP
ncbi:MAG: molecular chaperone TorD family protein [Magnetococcales bacterium]|nr:molecular chaperone TorD family protein [Magnetococcales bacterium]